MEIEQDFKIWKYGKIDISKILITTGLQLSICFFHRFDHNFGVWSQKQTGGHPLTEFLQIIVGRIVILSIKRLLGYS